VPPRLLEALVSETFLSELAGESLYSVRSAGLVGALPLSRIDAKKVCDEQLGDPLLVALWGPSTLDSQ
jgi:hypothetical protein